MKNQRFFGATSILIGTVVGAGIFGLPYAFAKIGFVGGLFYLLVLMSFLQMFYHIFLREFLSHSY